MRIISKFRDYYDGVMASGRDEELTYARESFEFELGDGSRREESALLSSALASVGARRLSGFSEGVFDRSAPERIAALDPDPDCGFVVFCGKVYPFAGIPIGRGSSGLTYCHSEEQALRAMESYLGSKAFLTWMSAGARANRGERRIPRWDRGMESLDPDGLRAFFACSGKGGDAVLALHRHGGTPCYVLRRSCGRSDRRALVFGNPRLADFGFQRKLDAFSTFQELSMYLGGVLGRSAPPMLSVSDEIRASKKGFDEWSFRRPPKAAVRNVCDG
jgi:hypothetical protein